jgi:hypothetical protein
MAAGPNVSSNCMSIDVPTLCPFAPEEKAVAVAKAAAGLLVLVADVLASYMSPNSTPERNKAPTAIPEAPAAQSSFVHP